MQKMRLKDYKQPNFRLNRVELFFDLDPEETTVTSRMHFSDLRGDLALDGKNLSLQKLSVDGEDWQDFREEAEETETRLIIGSLPETCTIEVICKINPAQNTSLDGLYISQGRFFTQNEPQGFRRVTYFPDRPDVMAEFQTTIVANKEKYPILLSNGDLISKTDLPDGLHRCVFEDPHRKPCYLFALVAGDFAQLQDQFVTCSGRTVALEFYSEASRIDQCHFAMESLKKAMRWDEERFGLEYDLDSYKVVVVDDFNGGAMENKGLNIFNTRCVLADPKITTDREYEAIEAVVGHEYFHNWTGNRVTLRDWFHLSLKEGLTVFRDQEFSADLHSQGVTRVDGVQDLWLKQFPEDSGPNAHPVRPQESLSVDNFFSPTVYEKGAEVIRMILTIVGREGFRQGMDHYISTYDGSAVTIEEFVSSFEKSCDVDLAQFRRWYEQKGTPLVKLKAKEGGYEVSQQNKNPEDPPLVIPMSFARYKRSSGDLVDEGTVLLKERKQSIECLPDEVLSVFRGYSAPVHIDFAVTSEERAHLISYEQDMFQIWNQSQHLLVECALKGEDQVFVHCISGLLDRHEDQSFLAKVLSVPTDSFLISKLGGFDPDQIFQTQMAVARVLSATCKPFSSKVLQALPTLGDQSYSDEVAGTRGLLLQHARYLIAGGDEAVVDMALDGLHSANATVFLSLASSLLKYRTNLFDQVMDTLRDKMLFDDFFMNKYYQLLSAVPHEKTLDRIEQEITQPPFQLKNPNNVSCLIGQFAAFNVKEFHQDSGRGYEFLANQILKIDPINPQTSARLCRGFERLDDLPAERRELMAQQMQKISRFPGLSANVMDLVQSVAKL